MFKEKSFLIIILCLFIVCAINVTASYGTIYFNDTAESGTIAGNGWVTVAGENQCTYSTDTAYSGGKSIKCAGSVSGLKKLLNFTLYPVTIEGYFYYNGTSSGTSGLLIGSDCPNTGTTCAMIGDRSGSSVTNWYWGVPDSDSGVGGKTTGWHLLTINVTSSTNAQLYADYVLVKSGASASTASKFLEVTSYTIPRYFDNVIAYNWTPAVAINNSCSCPNVATSNWIIQMSDNCKVTGNCLCANLTLNGTGTLNRTGTLFNYTKLTFSTFNTSIFGINNYWFKR